MNQTGDKEAFRRDKGSISQFSLSLKSIAMWFYVFQIDSKQYSSKLKKFEKKENKQTNFCIKYTLAMR